MVHNDLRSKLNEYNWDDGFEIPKEILAAPGCDLALSVQSFCCFESEEECYGKYI